MKKILYILLLTLSLSSCYTQNRVYRGEVRALYIVTTWLGEKYYLVEIVDDRGRRKKIRVEYSEWRQLKSGQEVVIY